MNTSATATARQPQSPRPERANRGMTGLIWLITAGILLQALTAGQFISGLNNLLPAHQAVGTLLEWVGVVLVLVAAFARRTRQQRRAQWLAALLLGVAVFVQGSLGHAPGAVPTAIHVPLGVMLFAWAAALSMALARPLHLPAGHAADLGERPETPLVPR